MNGYVSTICRVVLLDLYSSSTLAVLCTMRGYYIFLVCGKLCRLLDGAKREIYGACPAFPERFLARIFVRVDRIGDVTSPSHKDGTPFPGLYKRRAEHDKTPPVDLFAALPALHTPPNFPEKGQQDEI